MNLKCPKCGEELDVSGRASGSRVTCASCGTQSTSARKAPRALKVLGALAVVCLCLGAAALTLSRFVKFADRPYQSECMVNLKSWFTAQRSLHKGFALEVDTVGFHPERGNRYAYFAGPGPIEDRGVRDSRHGPDAVGYGVDLARLNRLRPITFEHLPPEVARGIGFSGSQCPQGPDCAITLACAGNLDGDDTLDVWTISTVDRVGPDGEPYEAGKLMHHVDDVDE